jgi:hypothetical protein
VGVKQFARFGWNGAACEAVNERASEMLFQVFYVTADRWLGEMDALAGFTEAGQFNDFAKNVKLPQIHGCIKD